MFQTSLRAEVEESGAITLPARLFGDIVSRLSSDSPLTLADSENGEQVELTSLSGSYQIRGLPAEDFPDLPLVQSGTPIRLNAESLVRGLRATVFASSADESKQLLTGVHLRLDGNGLECAATDGHRLAVLRLPHVDLQAADADGSGELSDGEPFDVTVPARSLRELERLLSSRPGAEPLSLFCERGQVVVLRADQVLTSRSLEGTYPNYRQLIPESFQRRSSLDRRAFLAALERVAVLADPHNNVVKISCDPDRSQVVISADAQDLGQASEALAATISGEAIQIAFNVRYLMEGLKAMGSEQVVLQSNGPTTPAVLVPFDDDTAFTYLVMPVQIRA
jgi:DNA polymerase-3 subunit beta